MERLTRLSDRAVYLLLVRAMERLYDLMAGLGSGNHFGWDWPTARVYYPRRCRIIGALKSEGQRRGLHLRHPDTY